MLAGQRGQQRGGNDAEEESGHAFGVLGDLGRTLCAGRNVQALTRVDQVSHDQADGQGESRHQDEVAKGQPAHLAHRCRFGD